MSSIPPISPVASHQSDTIASSPASPLPGAASVTAEDSFVSTASQPSATAGIVDSVSLSAHGERVMGTVTYSSGEYVASEPGPPQVSASGNSPSDATSKLVMAVYRLG